MKTDIIDPLLQKKVLESFHGDLNDVDMKVSRGLLTNVREVEARLISKGRIRQTSREVYEEYVEAVIRVCDDAMSPETEWRARFYRTYLVQIQAIVIEFEQQKRRGAHIVNQMQLCGRSYLPAKGLTAFAQKTLEVDFEASFRTPESDPPDEISPSSGTTFQDASSADSTYLASADTSPVSTVAEDLFDAYFKFQCPECKEPFHGDSRASNLRRHIRNSHGTNVQLDCPMPGCKRKRGRSDNMHKHLRQAHGVVSPRAKLPPPTRTGKQRTTKT
ncbi:MAG: hypothetical protein Q9167_002867 [Letrouitia subvulpina]